MLEVLLVPMVTSAAARLVKAAVGGDDGKDAGALAADLIGAMFTRRDQTAAAIEELSAQVADVRDTQWKGPYRAGMDQLEKASRGGVTADHRAELLRVARERFSDAKGAAPNDPAIIATLDVYYALVWVAEGRIELAKGQLASTEAALEEVLLTTHIAANKDMQARTRFQRSRSRDTTVESAARYFLGSKVFSTPPDPMGQGGSYARLTSLIADHASLQRLRMSLYSIGDHFAVACSLPVRGSYENGHGALVVDQPRHVTANPFGVTVMVSLAPFGPNRPVDFLVANGRPGPVEVRVAATSDPTPSDLATSAVALQPGATCRTNTSDPIVLTEAQSFVMELRIPTVAGSARVVVPFAPTESMESQLLLSFQDVRALEAVRRASTDD